MSIKPENIGSSTGPIGIGISDIVSENLPITEVTTSPWSITRQIHSARVVVIMKAITGASIGSWFSVVETIDEL